VRFYFDTEFLDDGHTIELISIGIVNEDGLEYYAVNSEFDEQRATEWLQTRVLNHIPRDFKRKLLCNIRQEVNSFLHGPGRWDQAEAPEIWGWYPAYDWVVLCQMYGPLVNRPAHFPKRPNDLKQLAEQFPHVQLPRQQGTKHHPLEDAKWVRDAHNVLRTYEWAREQRRYPYFGEESDNPLTHAPRGATGL
jgi:hypothetical protein